MNVGARAASLAVLFWLTPLVAQTPPQPPAKPKLGGAAAAPVIAVKSGTQTQAAAVANPAADLGFKVAISEEEKIQRLQKRVAELMHQMQALQKEYESLNASLGALAKSTVTFRCDNTDRSDPRSVNSLGAWVSCSPYACDAPSGRCYVPLCAGTAQCASGFVCDVGGSSLCVSSSGH
jgi:hypothetical protein